MDCKTGDYSSVASPHTRSLERGITYALKGVETIHTRPIQTSGILKFELSDSEMVNNFLFFQSFKRGSVGGIVAGQLTALSILS